MARTLEFYFVGDMMFFGNDRLPCVEMALTGDLK
jgi:hypothetical protein